MPTILINATAARYSGALTILKDFMSFVYCQSDFRYHVDLITSTKGVFQNKSNVSVHEIEPKNWYARIKWDKNGLQKWCETNGVVPDLVISFQNTCSRFSGRLKGVKQLVYYHQLLPLIGYKWKWYKKEERSLFLYANFYKFFVNRYNENAEYVVQLPYIKQLFCDKFKNITPKKVHVIRPNLPGINISTIERKNIAENKKLFLFPASALEYKNHKIIVEALKLLINENSKLADKILVIFTISDRSRTVEEFSKQGLDSVIKCMDSIPYNELLTYYKRCDALLFPSKIESFGLPLVEAAMFGKKIIAADLPYAREVLKDYQGVSFADVNNPAQWCEALKNIINSDTELFTPLQPYPENTWNTFMSLALNLC